MYYHQGATTVTQEAGS